MHKLTSLIAAGSLLVGATAFAQTEHGKPAQPGKPAAKQPDKPADKKADDKKAPKLGVGDQAPGVTVEKWLKGAPATSFDKGHIYVVEFWATWCPPCKESIPHLTKLQKDYKDKVTFIGVNIGEDWRGKAYSDKTLPEVEKFVKDMGDKMDYTIAYDGAAKATDKAYFQAAGQNGIPAAFIVNGEGKITWIGNPLDDAFTAQIKKVAGAGHDKDKKKDKDAESKKGGA